MHILAVLGVEWRLAQKSIQTVTLYLEGKSGLG